jgi:hypothetical protein
MKWLMKINNEESENMKKSIEMKMAMAAMAGKRSWASERSS